MPLQPLSTAAVTAHPSSPAEQSVYSEPREKVEPSQRPLFRDQREASIELFMEEAVKAADSQGQVSTKTCSKILTELLEFKSPGPIIRGMVLRGDLARLASKSEYFQIGGKWLDTFRSKATGNSAEHLNPPTPPASGLTSPETNLLSFVKRLTQAAAEGKVLRGRLEEVLAKATQTRGEIESLNRTLESLLRERTEIETKIAEYAKLEEGLAELKDLLK